MEHARLAPDRHQTSLRGSERGADESRLLAPGHRTHLPSRNRSQWSYESMFKCPLQWRGRIGFEPISVAPVRVRL